MIDTRSILARARALAVTLAVAALALAGAQQAQPAPAAPGAVDPWTADPRWGAPAWGAPGWWDPLLFDVEVAMVRVAHFSPDTDDFQLVLQWPQEWYVDPATAGDETATALMDDMDEEFREARATLDDLEYGQITDYVMVPAGTHLVWIREVGEDGALMYEAEVNFDAGAYYTVTAEGSFEVADVDFGFRLNIYPDVPSDFPPAGHANVRVIHAAIGYAPVDVWAYWTEERREQLAQWQAQWGTPPGTVAPGTEPGAAPADPAAAPADPAAAPTPADPAVTTAPAAPAPAADFQVAWDLSYATSSGYQAVRGIGYDIDIRVAGTNEIIYQFSGEDIHPSAIYTVFVIGSTVTDDPLEVIVLRDVELVNVPAADTGDDTNDDGNDD